MQEKQYEQAVDMITDGIKIAEAHNHHGTIADWKDKLLDIFLLRKNNFLSRRLVYEWPQQPEILSRFKGVYFAN